MLNRRQFTTSLAAFGTIMLSVSHVKGQDLPVVRLGNASGLIDPQLIFMTMGQHPDLDYYREEGCIMDIINMTGSGQTMQQIIAGNVETSAVAPLAILPVFADNPTIDVVYPYAWLRQPHWGVAVKPDSDIQSLEDLRGKNIGIRNQGDTGYFGARAMLREIGMDPDRDVEWTAVDQGGPAGQALYGDRIDAMAFWDGGFARIEIAGFPLRFIPNSSGMQQLFGNAFCVRKSDFEENRDVYTRFFRAMARSTVFAYEDTDLSIRMHWDIYPESKATGLSDEEALEGARHIINARRDKWLPAPYQEDKRFGAMSLDEWEAWVTFMELDDKIDDITQLFTDEIIDDVNNFDRDAILAQVEEIRNKRI